MGSLLEECLATALHLGRFEIFFPGKEHPNVTKGIRTLAELAAEMCGLVDGGNRMICSGKVTTPTGVRTYLEDFDWFGESPHPAASR